MSDEKLGPTGLFPNGKLNQQDDGQIQFGLAADPHNGTVRIQFGAPVTWLALYPEQARSMAKILNDKADEVERGVN